MLSKRLTLTFDLPALNFQIAITLIKEKKYEPNYFEIHIIINIEVMVQINTDGWTHTSTYFEETL